MRSKLPPSSSSEKLSKCSCNTHTQMPKPEWISICICSSELPTTLGEQNDMRLRQNLSTRFQCTHTCLCVSIFQDIKLTQICLGLIVITYVGNIDCNILYQLALTWGIMQRRIFKYNMKQKTLMHEY